MIPPCGRGAVGTRNVITMESPIASRVGGVGAEHLFEPSGARIPVEPLNELPSRVREPQAFGVVSQQPTDTFGELLRRVGAADRGRVAVRREVLRASIGGCDERASAGHRLDAGQAETLDQ